MPTRRRLGEIQRAVFTVLYDEPDGMQAAEVLARVEQLLPPTPVETGEYPNAPGVRRYPKTIRFATITSVKAGWLVKDSGQWRLTPAGREAYDRLRDPEEFQREAIEAYKQWKERHATPGYTAEEAAEDEEAARLEGGSASRRRCWLVRGANVGGVNVLPEWFAGGYCSVRYAELPPIAPGTPRSDIAALVRDALPESGAPGLHAGVIHRFLNEMNPGDLVVTVHGRRVYVGRIAGEPFEGDSIDTLRRRPVEWLNVAEPALRSDLSSEAADGLRGQMTVSDLSRYAAEFAALVALPDDDDSVDAAEALYDVGLPMPTQELAESLMLPREWLGELVDMLNEKRQIVLYGPPGTGKTYLARRLCESLVEASGGEYTVVQFHPSYAYEDFFEGFRPRLATDGSGGVGFELVSGPLRRLAQQATDDPRHPYALIIDEINRANIAKVFGELYFLLEYRGHSIQLQYSDAAFTLPRNLFAVATMNTADRSIALVDAAMRRRFYFQSMFPGEPPVADLLRTWLARNGLSPEPASLLEELNRRIDDRDFAIGPSYLMTRRAGDDAGLHRIWRGAILPLLEEHFFGEDRDIDAEFGLAALRTAIGGGEPRPVTEDAAPA